jgi:RNA polymerase sigma factor (sigma-70 family)
MNLYTHKDEIASWWLSFRKGNKEAFATIYKQFYPKLYAYGLKFTRDDEQIRDIIQDLFAKLYEKPDLVTNADTLQAFLFASFRNACINHAQYALRHVDIQTVPDFDLPFEVTGDLLEDQEEEEQVHRRVESILNSLTPRQREIIYLRFLHELDYDEISRIMHLSNQAARNLIHRAITYIRKKYSPLLMFFSF